MFEKLKELNDDYNQINNFIGTILNCPGKGGNISVKDGDLMIIKSSGEDLKKPHLKTVIKNDKIIGSYDNEFCELYSRPSMEVSFHKILPYKYVAHYHPIYVLPYLCSDSGLDMIDAKPGSELSEKIQEYVRTHNNIDYIFLKNHGIIICSNNILQLRNTYDIIKSKYFIHNINSYTPDDLVDTKSDELWLFRNVIENIANKMNLKLNTYNHEEILQDESEKYRQSKM